jgi:hypothetical protein
MFGKVTGARAVITNEFLEYEICAMFAMDRNGIACPRFGFVLTNLGVFCCDPNLQSLLLSRRHSLARRLLRLLKTNPRRARPMKEPSLPALPAARKRNTKTA